jgi:glycosyltransferase involved in cell wall biosynthesis
MRIAIVYDCLFPHTVGGAERWYRNLAERLAARHEVSYLTRRQWPPGEEPGTPFPVAAVSPGGELYTDSGRRRIWPPLRFGIGVFWHLLRHGRKYDVVHSASFPYFSLIGAWLALRLRGHGRLVVDWHEVWTSDYWREYLGPVAGRVAWIVQRICVRLPDESFTFSRLHAERLLEEGHRGPITRLTGQLGDGAPSGGPGKGPDGGPPVVVFAGRHIPEKGVTIVPDVVALARGETPALRCLIFGDGPEQAQVAERVRALGLQDAIELPGRVSSEDVDAALANAACLLLPSRREGYGQVVVEAIARGTPAVVVAAPDNAAVELVEDGVNGFVAAPEPGAIAAAVGKVLSGGADLRKSTRSWYESHRRALSIESSLDAVEKAYERETR